MSKAILLIVESAMSLPLYFDSNRQCDDFTKSKQRQRGRLEPELSLLIMALSEEERRSASACCIVSSWSLLIMALMWAEAQIRHKLSPFIAQ